MHDLIVVWSTRRRERERERLRSRQRNKIRRQWARAQCELTELNRTVAQNKQLFDCYAIIFCMKISHELHCSRMGSDRIESNAIGNRCCCRCRRQRRPRCCQTIRFEWLIMRIRLNASVRQNVLFWSHAQIIKQWIRSGFFPSSSACTHIFYVFPISRGCSLAADYRGKSSLQVVFKCNIKSL